MALLNRKMVKELIPNAWSGDFPQLGHAANFHPLDDENISVVIKIRAVGRDKFARRKMIARLVTETLI
jgi:hypothetical protein